MGEISGASSSQEHEYAKLMSWQSVVGPKWTEVGCEQSSEHQFLCDAVKCRSHTTKVTHVGDVCQLWNQLFLKLPSFDKTSALLVSECWNRTQRWNPARCFSEKDARLSAQAKKKVTGLIRKTVHARTVLKGTAHDQEVSADSPYSDCQWDHL